MNFYIVLLAAKSGAWLKKMILLPQDFMFELTKNELERWRRQFGTSKGETKGLRYKPMAFTEQGVAMLSSVLRSKRAIYVNIFVLPTATK